MSPMLAVSIVFAVLFCVDLVFAAVFLGGTMSCDVLHADDVIVRAKITVLTGWKLGTGPCGSNCSSANIGMETNNTRAAIQRQRGIDYFGAWLLEFRDKQSPLLVKTINITQHITDIMAETVEDVNVEEGWEMSRIEFVLDIPSYESYADIILEGRSWPVTSLQSSVQEFHLQIKIEQPMIRNDTKRADRVPEVVMKPYYRLLPDRTYNLKDLIRAKDPDDDYLLIFRSMYIEAGRKLGNNPFPGIAACSGNCDYISTTHLKPKDTGIISVSVVSMNRREIVIEAGNKTTELAPTSFLARVPVQFFVEIVNVDESPVFLSPYNERHVLFNGVAFSETFSAESSSPSRQITKIDTQIDYSLVQKNVNFTSASHKAKSVVSWMPIDRDNHLICATAEDSAGYKSTLMNCHTIVIADFDTDGLTENDVISSTSPLGFVHFPKYGSFKCEIQENCRFPVYAVSRKIGAILNITIKSTDISSAKIVSRIRVKSRHTSVVDVEFKDTHYGLKAMCFEVTDGINTMEKCMHIKILDKDPCDDKPCKNGAKCVPLEYNRDFVCQCRKNTEGKRCERLIDLCQSNPCQNGGSCIQPHMLKMVFCLCQTGFSGKFCEIGDSLCSDAAPGDCADPEALQYICIDPLSATYCKKSCGLCGSLLNVISPIVG